VSTAIEWADETINPVIGCRRCSPACDHCYAERFASRGMTAAHAAATRDGRWTGELVWQPKQLEKLERWKDHRRVFVGSMSDLALCSTDQFAMVWSGMEAAPWHTYLLLTKRPRKLGRLIERVPGVTTAPDWLWVGCTAWDHESAGINVPDTLNIPAAGHFVSLEPMLGSVDLTDMPCNVSATDGLLYCDDYFNALSGAGYDPMSDETGDPGRYPSLDWVIVGGESGRGARPLHPQWVRDVRDQCAYAGVPFMFKQWGEWGPDEGKEARRGRMNTEGVVMPSGTVWRVGKHAAGRMLDGREHLDVPEAIR